MIIYAFFTISYDVQKAKKVANTGSGSMKKQSPKSISGLGKVSAL